MTINNPYLDFVQMHSLISSNNIMDNNLKEILGYVYLGSIVNNWLKNEQMTSTVLTLNIQTPQFLTILALKFQQVQLTKFLRGKILRK